MPLAIAALCLGVAVVGGCSLGGEISDARTIDAAPVRVHGVIDRVEPVKGGKTYWVSYRFGGRRFTTANLPVGSGAGPMDPTTGSSVCLEASGEHPGTVRLCGQRYPGGDDLIPAEGLIVLAGVVGVLMAAGWILKIRDTGRDARSVAAR
ncbi:hypothetical protein [Streptomyces sp. NPDC001068]|uniref:hypothetical protein n=1 Tax=Streptomyces sp. NPDC001068 TaxID=3364544 RepID=UPI00369A0EE7